MDNLLVIGSEITFRGKTYRCAIGRAGIACKEKEGDGITPVGIFPLRECWYRADLMDAPTTGLPLKIIQPDDGWCDDPNSPEYNRHIKIPSPTGGRLGRGLTCSDGETNAPLPASPLRGEGYEKLWRDDGAYDLIVPIGYNDKPVIAGQGSAIFLHVAKPENSPTEGCLALVKADLLEILEHLDANSVIEIRK